MAIGPSDTLLGEGQKPRRPGLPATFETNPVLSGPPGQGPAAPVGVGTQRPSTLGRSSGSPAASPAAAAPKPPTGPSFLESISGQGFMDRMQQAGRNVGAAMGAPSNDAGFAPGGKFGVGALDPRANLTAAERGAAIGQTISGNVDRFKNAAIGGGKSFRAAVETGLGPIVSPVVDFAKGLLGGQEGLSREAQARAATPADQMYRPPSRPAPAQQGAPQPPQLLPEVVPAAAPGMAGTQAAPMNTIIGADGQPRAAVIAPGLQGGPVAMTPAAQQQPQAPALPMQMAPGSVARADPSRTRAGDEATRGVMQEIESQLFRNSFAAGRGSRSARGLQGQLTQALAGLAPTLGASADAADARNVQARTALAQTQAQQNAAQLQAQTAAGINERRAQAAELVAQIGAGARPPTLLTGEQGAFSIGPNGQAVPVLAPDGSQVRPAGGGGQGIRPDTLFKEFNARIAAIQGDPTLSPELKAQQVEQLYADPLFQGLTQYLPQPGQ